jgi:hypothetical protein
MIVFIVLFYGCGKRTADKNSSPEVVNINPYEATDYVNLSEIVDSVKYIKLQTDPDDVMGRILGIIIRQKYIYAIDVSQTAVFVFDKTGKFVSKLAKRGQGPDEYNYMQAVFVDKNEEYIELLSYKGRIGTILKYANISFELIEKIQVPEVTCNSSRKHAGFYYFALQQIDNTINGKNTNAGLVVWNDKYNESILFDKNIETNHEYFSPNMECFTENDKNELFVSIMYDNTFYQLDAGKAYPVLTVDFEKYDMNHSIGLKSTKEQMKYIEEHNKFASFPILNMNNPNILALSYYFKEETEQNLYREKDIRQYVKIKNSNKVYHTKKFRNDITDFPDYVFLCSWSCAHEIWHDNYLVDIVFPNLYFSKDETQKIFVESIGEITAFDEPVIVMMKLKE